MQVYVCSMALFKTPLPYAFMMLSFVPTHITYRILFSFAYDSSLEGGPWAPSPCTPRMRFCSLLRSDYTYCSCLGYLYYIWGHPYSIPAMCLYFCWTCTYQTAVPLWGNAAGIRMICRDRKYMHYIKRELIEMQRERETARAAA